MLDFGIAKAPSDTQFHLTRTTAVMGSPGYMSPEQLRSTRDADARSDIWALGVILYELTAGRPPFVAESITELTLRVAMDPTPRLPGVPPEFERVVARCLEKDPNRRFGNVAELAAALVPFGTGRAAELVGGIANMLRASVAGAAAPSVASVSLPAGPMPLAAAPVVPPVIYGPPPTTLESSASAFPSAAGTRSRLPWGVMAGVALVAVIAIVVVKVHGSDGPAMTQPRDNETSAPQAPMMAAHPAPPAMDASVAVEPTTAATPTAATEPGSPPLAAKTTPAPAVKAEPSPPAVKAEPSPPAVTAAPSPSAVKAEPPPAGKAETPPPGNTAPLPPVVKTELSTVPKAESPVSTKPVKPTQPPAAPAPKDVAPKATPPKAALSKAPPKPPPKDIGESRE